MINAIVGLTAANHHTSIRIISQNIHLTAGSTVKSTKNVCKQGMRIDRITASTS